MNSLLEERLADCGPARLLAELPFSETPPRGVGRLAILQLVHSRPGLHKMAIQRATGLSWGTVSYHLDALRSQGHIEEEREGKELYVFAPGIPALHRKWLAVLQAGDADRVASLIAKNREASVSELASGLSLPRKSAQRLLCRLESAGLVVKLGKGRIRYTLSETWRTLARYARSYGIVWAGEIQVKKTAVATPTGQVLVSSQSPCGWKRSGDG